MAQIRLLQIGSDQMSPLQCGFTQSAALQTGALKVGLTQIRPVEVGILQFGPLQNGLAEVGPTKVRPLQVGILEQSSMEGCPLPGLCLRFEPLTMLAEQLLDFCHRHRLRRRLALTEVRVVRWPVGFGHPPPLPGLPAKRRRGRRWYPCRELNPELRIRNPPLYPFNYRGSFWLSTTGNTNQIKRSSIE